MVQKEMQRLTPTEFLQKVTDLQREVGREGEGREDRGGGREGYGGGKKENAGRRSRRKEHLQWKEELCTGQTEHPICPLGSCLGCAPKLGL